MKVLASGRIFASHYQVMITDNPERTISDAENWEDAKVEKGFAGGLSCRLFGTEADLNDHWIQVIKSEYPPDMTEYQRVTCTHFRTETGKVHLMSVVDSEPVISTDIGVGDYSLFFAGSNLGVDQLSLREDGDLSDSELESRADLERYVLYIVPGKPELEGKLKDD